MKELLYLLIGLWTVGLLLGFTVGGFIHIFLVGAIVLGLVRGIENMRPILNKVGK